MDAALAPSAEHRPDSNTLRSLRESCGVLADRRGDFDQRFADNLGPLLAPGHPLDPAVSRVGQDLADAVVASLVSGAGPDEIEAQWQQLGEHCGGRGFPDDTFAAVGRALVRTARDVSGDSWSSVLSSGWAALHLWMVGHLAAGAGRARSAGQVWYPFPELAPQPGGPTGSGAIPTGSMPTGSVALGSAQTGSVPTGQVATGRIGQAVAARIGQPPIGRPPTGPIGGPRADRPADADPAAQWAALRAAAGEDDRPATGSLLGQPDWDAGHAQEGRQGRRVRGTKGRTRREGQDPAAGPGAGTWVP